MHIFFYNNQLCSFRWKWRATGVHSGLGSGRVAGDFRLGVLEDDRVHRII